MADALVPRPPPRLLRFYRRGLVAHTALICLISAGAYAGVLPTKSVHFPHYDLVMHFLLVGMWGFFLDGALAHRAIANVAFFPRLGPGIALVLAAIEETLQRFSPRRSSTWSDFAANAIGILFCAWMAKRLTLGKLLAEPSSGPPSVGPRGGEEGTA
ncbi:MAG: hypothetical protein R3B70_18030 [Polyangiaceae bacterium]